MRLNPAFAPLALVLAGCSAHHAPDAAPGAAPTVPAPSPAAAPLDRLAVEYVKLVLATGERDPGYVDAYYGPAEWQKEVHAAPPELPAIRSRAERLVADLSAIPASTDEMAELRLRYLRRQTESLLGRLDMLQGKKLRFDDESKVLYDAVAPHHPESHYRELIAQIDALVPGEGPVHERVDAYQRR